MSISRIRITKQHLKSVKKRHIYDGVWKYKQPKANPELERLTVMVMYDLFENFIKENTKEK